MLAELEAQRERDNQLWAWRKRIASERGPSDYTTRLVLLALAVLMESAGTNTVRVTQDQLAAATGLSRTWIVRKTRDAHAVGWVRRSRPRGMGRSWAGYDYTICTPMRWCDVNSVVPHGTVVTA